MDRDQQRRGAEAPHREFDAQPQSDAGSTAPNAEGNA
jgi:hypothetical protein